MSNTPNRSDVKQSPFVVAQDTNTGKITRVALPSDTQVGTRDVPAELLLFGRLSLATKQYQLSTHTNGAAYLTNNDTVAGIVNSLGAVTGTVYLPASPRAGQFHVIKDEGGNAAVSNILITGSNGALIDGSQSYILSSSMGKVCVYWRATSWFVMFP